MANPMDSIEFLNKSAPYSAPLSGNIFEIIQRAQQDPVGFEQMIKQMNPEGYQRALQIRNSQNPRAIIMEMARAQGVNPNIFNMLGIR